MNPLIITTILTTAAFVAGVDATAVEHYAERVSYYQKSPGAITRADEDFHRVVLTVDYDLPIYQELNGLFALESTGVDQELYYGYSEEEDSPVYQFDLPSGSYDFYVGALLGNFEGMMMLTLNNIEVNQDLDLNLKASTAVYRTDIRHIAPDGSELKLKYGPQPGASPSAQLLQAVMHKDQLIYLNGLVTDSQTMNYVISNNKESNFSLTRLDIMHSPCGFLNMIIPVNFNEEFSGSSSSGWQLATESFAETPANRLADAANAAEYGPDYYYSFGTSILSLGGRTEGLAGVGMFDHNCTTGTVGVWVPENYDGTLDLWPVPMGAVISGWSSATSALPLKRTENGLRQIGVNLFPDRLIYLCGENSPIVGPENPAYSGAIPEVELGNCTPLLVLIPEEEYFEFSFNGRHGEAMSQASDYYVIPSIEYWDEVFTKPLCDLKFYRNDELICSDRIDFPYDAEWDEPADYRLEISTDNVLIDGEIPGFVKATHSFGPLSDNLMPPTMTSLRIVNADGEINDRLTEKTGAKAIFTGGHFTYNDNYAERYVYAGFDPIECISVEYAPRATEDFYPLAVEETGEPVLPGYGNEFAADLSGVTAESTDGWYDLRITIQDESGATQTQLISPAFRVDTGSGVKCLPSSSNKVDLNSSDIEIYTIEGCRVDRSALTKGLYVVKINGRTEKIIL